MGEYWYTYFCCGLWLLAPVFTFILGLQIGRRGLPYRLRLEKIDAENFAVED